MPYGTLVGECAYEIVYRQRCHDQHDGHGDCLCEWMLHVCTYQALPTVTGFVHVTAAQIRLVWFLLPKAYQLLPNITGPSFWVNPGHGEALPTPLPAVARDDMWGYNELELVVGGAVDEGDVVLTFIG